MEKALGKSSLLSLEECLRLILDGEAGAGELGLRTLIQANPQDLNAWGHLAYLLFSQKRYREAAECYRTCHRISPALIDAVLYEVDCMEKLGNRHQAFQLLRGIQPIPSGYEIPVRDRLSRIEPWGHYLASRLRKRSKLISQRLREWGFIRGLLREIGLLPFSFRAIRDSGMRGFLRYLSRGFLEESVYRYPVPPCDLCGSSFFRGVFFIDSRKIIRCCRCGLERVERVPPGGQDVASGFYEREEVIADMVADWQDPIIIRHRMGWLEILFDVAGLRLQSEKSRIFEFGCGSGEFLAHLKGQGFEVAGMDGSARLVERAQQVFHLPVDKCCLADLPKPKEACDVALAFHILEHLDSPSLLFKHARKILKQDGCLFIEIPVPDLCRLPVELKTHGSHGYGSSEHVHFLTLPLLERYFLSHGFQVIARYEYLAGDLPAGGMLGRLCPE